MADVSYLTCTNKGCYATGYHKLDLDSNAVTCEDCGQDVDVSPYMKKILKSNGQVFRKVKTAKEVVCPHCKKADVPVLLSYGNEVYEVVCAHCGGVNEHLTNYFIEPLKMNPGVERLKVKIKELGDGSGVVVLADGSPLPWNKSVSDEPDDDVFAEIEAETQAVIEDESLPEETRPSIQVRSRPATAQDMLGRAKMKYTGDILEPDPEPPVRKVMKKQNLVPNNRPKTAAEMLQQAGFELATPEEDELEG